DEGPPLLATGSGDRTVRVWQVRFPDGGWKPLQHTRPVLAMAPSPDGSCVLSSCNDSTIRLWDVRSRSIRLFRTEENATALAFSPDGQRFAVGHFDGRVQIHDTASFSPVGRPWKEVAAVLSLAFSPDGQLLAVGCNDVDRKRPRESNPALLQDQAVVVHNAHT